MTPNTPAHDLRELRTRLEASLRSVDAALERLANPDDPIDLGDYAHVVAYYGKRYRVTGSMQTPGDPDVRLYLTPIDAEVPA
jgi:hypothetical protein